MARGRLWRFLIRFRRLYRAAMWLGLGILGVGLLALLVLSFGLRYGFTRLPEPEPGVVLRDPRELRWSEVSPSNAWYWVRELQRKQAGQSNGLERADDYLRDYAAVGVMGLTNRSVLARWDGGADRNPMANWREANALALEYYPRVIAAADSREPKPEGGSSGQFDDAFWPAKIGLLHCSVWLAAEAESKGDIPAALGHLMDGLRLRQALDSYCRLGMSALTAEFAWRRLVLEGPALPPPVARRLLEELRGMTNSLPSPESAFCYDIDTIGSFVTSKANYDLQEGEPMQFPWRELASSVGGFCSEATDVAIWSIGKSIGAETRDRPTFEGVERFKEPLQLVLEWYSCLLTRRQDLVCLHEAYYRGVVSRLRSGNWDAAARWRGSLRERHHWDVWWAWFDRPLVWMSWSHYPELARRLQDVRTRQMSIEACRLTLALRHYKDVRGDWPSSLAQLVPDILSSVPIDSRSGKPFQYDASAGIYGFSSTSEDPDVPLYLRRRVFRSTQVQDSLVEWNKRMEDAKRPQLIDPRMMVRYGLLPSGVAIRGREVLIPAGAETNQVIQDWLRGATLPDGWRFVTNRSSNVSSLTGEREPPESRSR